VLVLAADHISDRPVNWATFPRGLAEAACDRKDGYTCFILAKMHHDFSWYPEHGSLVPENQDNPAPALPELKGCAWGGANAWE
jgi:hypothetical protein